MAIKLGEMFVSLGLGTGAWKSGLAGAKADMGKWTGDVNRLLVGMKGVFAGTAVAAVSSLAAMAKSGINTADMFNKLSQRTGVSTETLSALAHAAKLSDVSTEQLGNGLQKLSRAMFDSMTGTGESAEAFRLLGVQTKTTDGRLRDTKEVFFDVASAFSLMHDGAEKTALSMKIFGKSGAEMIPLLNQGSVGLRAMTAEAERSAWW